MTAQLMLDQSWDCCPESWRNFASDIHTKGGFLPEHEFWSVVGRILKDEHDAQIVKYAGGGGCIEFANEKDLTLFILRWS
jgi:hypothetical protein